MQASALVPAGGFGHIARFCGTLILLFVAWPPSLRQCFLQRCQRPGIHPHACRVVMRSRCGGVDANRGKPHLVTPCGLSDHRLHQSLEGARVAPLAEPVVDRGSVPELLQDLPLLGPGAKPPDHALESHPAAGADTGRRRLSGAVDPPTPILHSSVHVSPHECPTNRMITTPTGHRTPRTGPRTCWRSALRCSSISPRYASVRRGSSALLAKGKPQSPCRVARA